MAKKKSPLDPAQEQLLQSQIFDQNQPGPILHDFQQVLDYVGEAGVKAAGKYNLFPIEGIPVVDERLTRPLRLPLARPQLKSHPYLRGLHLLLRASGLGAVEGKGDKARLTLSPAVLAVWETLNPTERYFALLEAWLIIARPSMIGERGMAGLGYFYEVAMIWGSLARRGTSGGRRSGYAYDALPLALMDLFGLARIEFEAEPAVPWVPRSVAATPFGTALMTLLSSGFTYGGMFGDRDFAELGDEYFDEEGGFGQFQAALAPHFPQLKRSLALPEPEFRDGVFTFKVALGKIWRRIAIGADSTLEDLAWAILRSVAFDDDHLYEFSYRDGMGRTVTASRPEADGELSTEEVRIGQVPLQPGQSMTFLFDFGDNWEFTVALEKVDPPGTVKGKLPRVVEEKGRAPRQYPDWD